MAAGLGRRFGGNKLTQAAPDGVSLIECALAAIPGEKLARVVVVTQYPEIEKLTKKYGFTSLENPHPEVGQSESIRIGLGALSDCDAVMFQVADQPKLQKETVAELIDFAQQRTPGQPMHLPGPVLSGADDPHRGSRRSVSDPGPRGGAAFNGGLPRPAH